MVYIYDIYIELPYITNWDADPGSFFRENEQETIANLTGKAHGSTNPGSGVLEYITSNNNKNRISISSYSTSY
jgi:hypothetical protein